MRLSCWKIEQGKSCNRSLELMKNPIIFELRRIRDAHAKKCNYDFDTLAADWMKLDRWEKTKAVKHKLHDAVTDWHEIHWDNAQPAGCGHATQSQVSFPRSIAQTGNVHEFQSGRRREDDAGRTEPLANRGECIHHGFG